MNIKNIMFTMSLIFTMVAGDNRILLSDVKSLTLHVDHETTGRRVAPIQQLTCLGRYCDKAPDMVQCSNESPDGIVPHWKCNAVIDESVKFGYLNVQCEGYDYPDDPYILKNSCGLSYSLSSRSFNKSNPSTKDREPSPMGGIILLMMIVLALSSCSDSSSSYSSGSSRPGFWTGAAVGAMGASSYNRRRSGWGSGSSGFSTSRGFARTSRR